MMQKGDKVKVKLIDGRVVDAVVRTPNDWQETMGGETIKHHILDAAENYSAYHDRFLLAIEGREITSDWECEIVTE